MNNKAFTLIELTAIIIVLAAIFLVSFPNLLNITKADKEEEYDNMIENLCLAGKSYIYADIDSFPGLSTVGTQINITVNELITYGNVDKNLINPKTKVSVENDTLTYTVSNDFSLNCEYKEG